MTFDAEAFNAFLNTALHWIINYAVRILIVLIVWWVGSKLIKLVIRKPSHVMTDETVGSFVRSFLKIALKILLAIVCIAILGIELTGISAAIASAGVAIGLALQGGLSNIASGIMLVIFKPFEVGDYIEAAGEEGTVEKISIFYTTIITTDLKRVVIPNSAVTGSSVRNYSSEPHRRVDFDVQVAYGTDRAKVEETLKARARSNSKVLTDYEPVVRLKNFGSSSLDFTFRVWCNNADYWDVKFDLNEAIKDEFEKQNIEIPFTQIDVHTK